MTNQKNMDKKRGKKSFKNQQINKEALIINFFLYAYTLMNTFNLIICIFCIIAGLFTAIGGLVWPIAHCDFKSFIIGVYLM